MSFKRLEPEDFIISTDSIVAGAFNGSNGASGAQINSGLSDEYFAAYGADGIANYFTTICLSSLKLSLESFFPSSISFSIWSNLESSLFNNSLSPDLEI